MKPKKLLYLLMAPLLLGCSSQKEALHEGRNSLEVSKGSYQEVDTTRVVLLLERVTNYKNDTIIQVIEREQRTEVKGITVHRDTILINKVDTLYIKSNSITSGEQIGTKWTNTLLIIGILVILFFALCLCIRRRLKSYLPF